MPQENLNDNLENNLTFQQLFEQGLAQQQQKNIDAALSSYQKALDKGQKEIDTHQVAVIYHNMSTLAYTKNDFIKAYVWSKKALHLDSSNQVIQNTFNEFSKKFEAPQVAHQISNSTHIQKILSDVPIDVWCSGSLILFLLTLSLFLKNQIERKKAKIDSTFKSASTWPVVTSFFFTIIVISATVLVWSNHMQTKGVVTEKSSIQTAPGENKPVIFEALPGTEVEVLQLQADFVQVRYPGAFSGWMSQKNLEIF